MSGKNWVEWYQVSQFPFLHVLVFFVHITVFLHVHQGVGGLVNKLEWSG